MRTDLFPMLPRGTRFGVDTLLSIVLGVVGLGAAVLLAVFLGAG